MHVDPYGMSLSNPDFPSTSHSVLSNSCNMPACIVESCDMMFWAILQGCMHTSVLEACNLVQNKQPVNYWAEDYDAAQIKASATNFDDLIAGLRKTASQSPHHKR